jgi:SSS family solute:Na+ symporter
VVAINAGALGGVLSLVMLWFGALIGPASTPIILGLLPAFKRSGSAAAIFSWSSGIFLWVLVRFVFHASMAVTIGAPAALSVAVFTITGWLQREPAPRRVEALIESLRQDPSADRVFSAV